MKGYEETRGPMHPDTINTRGNLGSLLMQQGVASGRTMVEDALAALLAKNPDMPRDEPEVAASIGAQLEHMELTSMPTGLRRRIRDVISRVQPKRVCEVGSGIGHLSAWLFDYWSQDSKPEHFDMIEAGGKFGVILTRLLRRYNAEEWAHVRVGEFETLCAEMDSWKAANATLGEAAASTAPPLGREKHSLAYAVATSGCCPQHLPRCLCVPWP